MPNTAKIGIDEVELLLVERLRHSPAVRHSVFAKEIGASADTTRRAAKRLDSAGLSKYHHGVSRRLITSVPANITLPTTLVPAKPEVLTAVARLAEKDQAIVLDLNSVSVSLAQHLPAELNALIITNSPVVAASFAEHSQFQVRVIGGQLQNGSFIPLEAEEFRFLKNIRASLCVLGSCYVDLKWITSHSPEEAKLKGAMVHSAAKVVMTVSADTLNRTGPHKISPLKSLSSIVVEKDIPPAKLRAYKTAGIEILRA